MVATYTVYTVIMKAELTRKLLAFFIVEGYLLMHGAS